MDEAEEIKHKFRNEFLQQQLYHQEYLKVQLNQHKKEKPKPKELRRRLLELAHWHHRTNTYLINKRPKPIDNSKTNQQAIGRHFGAMLPQPDPPLSHASCLSSQPIAAVKDFGDDVFLTQTDSKVSEEVREPKPLFGNTLAESTELKPSTLFNKGRGINEVFKDACEGMVPHNLTDGSLVFAPSRSKLGSQWAHAKTMRDPEEIQGIIDMAKLEEDPKNQVLGGIGWNWVVLGGVGWCWVELGGVGWSWVEFGIGWCWVVLGSVGWSWCWCWC